MTDRATNIVRWATTVCFIGAFGFLIAAVPIADLTDALRVRIEGLGLWAPVIFAIVYGLATTVFVPGSALSLAAGLLFGLWVGTAVVWIGANIAIVLSFLIARYAARGKVEALAATRPRFAAVDRAVGEQGWKIVALMRLSPVFPFSLQNYLFGVTAIRFLPCIIASAAFILPGTFLYVYLGFAGGQAAAAVGGSQGADTLRLALQFAGLLATVVVTVAIARIAAKSVASHAQVDATPETEALEETGAKSSPLRTVLVFALAVACLVGAGLLFSGRQSLRSLFYPPEVILHERFANDTGRADFNHKTFAKLLKQHVGGRGMTGFEQIHGSVLDAAARYSPPLRRALDNSRALQIRWLPYDWALNEQPGADAVRLRPAMPSQG